MLRLSQVALHNGRTCPFPMNVFSDRRKPYALSYARWPAETMRIFARFGNKTAASYEPLSGWHDWLPTVEVTD